MECKILLLDPTVRKWEWRRWVIVLSQQVEASEGAVEHAVEAGFPAIEGCSWEGGKAGEVPAGLQLFQALAQLVSAMMALLGCLAI